MASGGKRGAGERVLESKHVIGLFLLMLLFSGVFFTLGYVMGRNQYDGQVRAANGTSKFVGAPVQRVDAAPKKSSEAVPDKESDPATSPSNSEPSNADWVYTGTNKPAKPEPRLEPVPKAPVTPPATKPAKARVEQPPAPTAGKSSNKTLGPPPIPNGALVLQVAALMKQEDALAIAGSLQKKHYAAYVQTPQRDKYYRVQVGPFKDQKSADAVRKGLQGEGFKAFYVKHG